MSYQPCTALITGGCGFIGSNFINYVFEKWPTTCFVNVDKMRDGVSETNIAEKIRHSNRYKLFKRTIRDADLLLSVFSKYQVDTVIHFAALTHVDESFNDRMGTIEENIMSMTILLETITFRFSGIKRFIHISTDEVYGESKENSLPKSEYSVLNPTNPYAASKASCEMILNAYWHSYKIPFITVRMNNVYGPNQSGLNLIPKFITLAVENKPFPLMGDGMHKRNWIHVNDCADAIKRVCEMGKIGDIYNIGTDFEITNYDVTLLIHQTVNELLQREMSEPKFETIIDRPYHDRQYCIDFIKISQELNWKAIIEFRDGLRSTVEHYVEQYFKKYAD
ncbi:unnamed protein product [Thelazia callipaeda]|uniref:dTDP-D-glucose 4,6-dehydratase n=1 Tax=Thelazia callipaeda TaxID=103827 RepID=A0A158RC10_THECL|nr:unnamed protein product [Thelazia callipaeda]